MTAKILPLAAVLLLGACTNSNESSAERREAADTPAGKVGKAAHGIVKETGKAAKTAGKQLSKAAQQAREGWKEAAREDKLKRER